MKLYWKIQNKGTSKTVTWVHKECTKENKMPYKTAKSRKFIKEEKRRPLKAVIHSNKDEMKPYFSSMI